MTAHPHIPFEPIIATLAVPMRASHPAPARDVLASVDGTVGEAAAHWQLTADRVVMHVRAPAGGQPRVLAVSLQELGRAMGDAVEAQAARIERLDPRRTP